MMELNISAMTRVSTFCTSTDITQVYLREYSRWEGAENCRIERTRSRLGVSTTFTHEGRYRHAYDQFWEICSRQRRIPGVRAQLSPSVYCLDVLPRGTNVNVNDLKDMLANLPQFQTQREQFSLHLDMAQEAMSRFEKKKLSLAAHVEQV